MDKFILFLATGFGLGNFVVNCSASFLNKFSHLDRRWSGSGLLGTVLGLGMVLLGFPVEGWQGFSAIFFITCLGFFVADRAEKIFQTKDDPRIIVDEIAGFIWSIAFFPLGSFSGFKVVVFMSCAFIFFRIFDVFKIPFRSAQNWKGGLGIMMDDLLAGLLVNLVLRVTLPYFI